MVNLERITHGHDMKGTPLLATRLGPVLIPDFDFSHLERWELNEIYGWKNVAVADYVRRFAVKSGSYILDTKTKNIKNVTEIF